MNKFEKRLKPIEENSTNIEKTVNDILTINSSVFKIKMKIKKTIKEVV
tara:strand:+ start:590 stop:733 length:144 start_codon:yes stop_codon:yes gene_type:complete